MAKRFVEAASVFHVFRCVVCLEADNGGASGKPPRMLLSRPKTAAGVRYYPPRDILNCDGSNFSSSWRDFRQKVEENQLAGFPMDDGLLLLASQIVQGWRSFAAAGGITFAKVVLLQEEVEQLNDFCLHGMATALWILYRHTFDVDLLFEIKGLLGWEEWPLDFSESSDWPTLWRMLPLHMEEALKRGGDSLWSRSYSGTWGREDEFVESTLPTVAEVDATLRVWLVSAGAGPHPVDRLGDIYRPEAEEPLKRALRDRLQSSATRRLRILVAGHHMGSSMEPYTMLREALRTGYDLQIQVDKDSDGTLDKEEIKGLMVLIQNEEQEL
eukprot:TRINITY_DN2262_c0_g1_i1.p1 TRINITY_DN2262_c0_g1~~TRINITY_DN2262_c0_g1_i1.p1  ORF type:complete len:327 (+),score=66.21 TRINITY_DN2262_c0_g1_i1:185-1165(+)